LRSLQNIRVKNGIFIFRRKVRLPLQAYLPINGPMKKQASLAKFM
jgi:hypothetical protein